MKDREACSNKAIPLFCFVDQSLLERVIIQTREPLHLRIGGVHKNTRGLDLTSIQREREGCLGGNTADLTSRRGDTRLSR